MFLDQVAAAGAVAVFTDEHGAADAQRVDLPTLAVTDPRARLGDVAAWVYGHPAQELLMLGVTGTNGKTTTTYLTDAGLRQAGHRTGVVGTVETRIADQVLASERTTPEATDVQALLAVMVERGCTAVSMEVSSHALALGRVDGTVFDVATFTNLSQDHLDFHRDLEDYFQAKARLFDPERSRAAVIDIDDPYGQRLVNSIALPVTTLTTRGHPDAHWRAEQVEIRPDGSSFVAVGPSGETAPVKVALPGAFNVANALAALVTLEVGGVPLLDAAVGIGTLTGVPGRMEPVNVGQAYLAFVDYAHTPDAVETLLTTVRQLTSGRLFVVLGCGGDRDRGKRPLMGRAAARYADVAVLTSDNPRSEDPAEILAAMAAGARDQDGEVVVIEDRAEAIAYATGRARPGDAVVVAGKGHETGQEVAGGVIHQFDDRDVLRRALRARGGAA
jgi:UDP-N-acetylmuramoyl-L-alanyl-D-glutamate--2,6-diaminopimelate ligase